MRSLIISTSLVVVAGALTGCATTKERPLLFFSTNVLGINVAAPEATGSGLSVNLGYKSLDIAIVPVTAEAEVNDRDIRGCYRSKVDGTEISNPCALEENVGAPNKNETKQGGVGFQLMPDRFWMEPITYRYRNGTGENAASIQYVADQPPYRSAGAFYPTVAAKATQPNAGTSQDQSMRDSLSVFSSFDSVTTAGSQSAAIQFGRMFATGVAAQQITEGINLQLRGKGHEQAECIRALVLAKEKGIADEKLPNCK
jgi:hypothetical protein